MKKLSSVLFAATVALAILSCSTKNENAVNSDPHVMGYNIDSSANIDAIKASAVDMTNYDSVSYKAKYVENAKFNDNLEKMTIKENAALITKMKNLGVTVKMEKMDAIWEEITNKPYFNSQNFVHSFYTAKWTRNGKTVTTVVSQIDAFNKEGKIMEEWLVSDNSALKELFK